MKRLLVWCALLCMACGGRRLAPAAAPGDPPEASAKQAAPVASTRWLSQLDVGHPLVGKVWDVRARALVAPEQVEQRASVARYVLLGEKHDNADHHLLQARLLRAALAAGQRRPALVLEMLEVEQQAAIDAYLATDGASAAGFGPALKWEQTSWPPYAEYQPILEEAFAAELPLRAGNLAHGTARALVKQGLAALPSERVKELGLEQPLPQAQAAELAEEMRASHCGHLPERLIEPMALAQRARDAQLAAVMIAAGRDDGAVLVAGAGHVRRDRGVPLYLARTEPQASTLAVALQEVRSGVEQPEHYDSQGFDFVWFTPRHSDEDPCAAFKKP